MSLLPPLVVVAPAMAAVVVAVPLLLHLFREAKQRRTVSCQDITVTVVLVPTELVVAETTEVGIQARPRRKRIVLKVLAIQTRTK